MDEVLKILNDMGDEYQCEFNEDNEDTAYEEWREANCEELEADIQSLLRAYLNNNQYYKGCLIKLKQHAVSSVKAWKGN